MGKWCEVKCDCADREPVSRSDRSFAEPFLRRRRPTALQRRARQDWFETVEGMYKCGHRHGRLVETWPGHLLEIGWALDAAYRERPGHFEVFRRISDSRNYADEYLALPPDAAALWRLEIEQLQRYLSAEEHMGFTERETFDRALAKCSHEDIQKALEEALRLCEASARSGNPVEFRL